MQRDSINPDASLNIKDGPSQSETVVDLTNSSQETPRGKRSKRARNSRQQISLEVAEKVPITIGCRMRVLLG